MAFRIRVPATIGNVGAGFDFLGLCISGLWDEIWCESHVLMAIDEVSGRQAELVPTSPKENILTLAASAYFEHRGLDGGVRFRLHRNLPISGGLGSSAAAAVGGAMAAALLAGDDPKSDEVVAAALSAESIFGGTHLDNIAPCLAGGLQVVRGVSPIGFSRAPCGSDFWLVVGTPHQRLDTKASRGVLPLSLPTETWVRQAANAATTMLAFATGDAELMKHGLIDHFAEPSRGPLIDRFGDIKRDALEKGALGVAISGGGPSVFGVCASRDVAEKVGCGMVELWGEGASYHVGQVDFDGARFERV